MTSRLPWFPEYIRENYPARGRLFGDFLGGLWATACDALEVPVEQAVRTTRMLRGLLPSWSGDAIGLKPAQPSYVAGDGFPAELSVNWSGDHPELRVLFDTLGEEDADSPVDTGETRYWGRIHELFTTLRREAVDGAAVALARLAAMRRGSSTSPTSACTSGHRPTVTRRSARPWTGSA